MSIEEAIVGHSKVTETPRTFAMMDSDGSGRCFSLLFFAAAQAAPQNALTLAVESFWASAKSSRFTGLFRVSAVQRLE